MTTHNSYFGGSVQSLGFIVDKTDHTVGVIQPGEYEFDATQHEEVRVVIGDLVDLRDNKNYGPGQTLPQFDPGAKVRLACICVVVYVCRYSYAPFRKTSH